MKGNADCHCYSPIGKDNHDKINWLGKQCLHIVHMKKGRKLCKLNDYMDCDFNACVLQGGGK